MFGSDWTMLGREHAAKDYARNANAAIRAVPFWQKHEQAVLRGNLARLLGT